MIGRYYKLSQTELDALTDDAFYELAARAQYQQKQDAEVVKYGLLLALEQVFAK